MSFLLDTNVLSELDRRAPDPRVVAWFAATDHAGLHTPSIVLAELLYGAERLGETRRAGEVRRFIDGLLLTLLAGRVLPFDDACARALARIWARAEATGMPKPKYDLLIAAVAVVHSLTLVTRNTRDFEGLGVPLLNPWEPLT